MPTRMVLNLIFNFFTTPDSNLNTIVIRKLYCYQINTEVTIIASKKRKITYKEKRIQKCIITDKEKNCKSKLTDK